jgi:DNA-binding MarR family transcriptional regulator
MNPDQLLEASITAHSHGLRGASLAALLIVLDKPEELGKIARRVGISSAAMTGFADSLYLKGYANRRSVEGDRRKWTLEITPKGKTTLAAILNQ